MDNPVETRSRGAALTDLDDPGSTANEAHPIVSPVTHWADE